MSKKFFTSIGVVVKIRKFVNKNKKSSKANIKSFAKNNCRELQIPFLVDKKILIKLIKVNYNIQIETKRALLLIYSDKYRHGLITPLG